MKHVGLCLTLFHAVIFSIKEPRAASGVSFSTNFTSVYTVSDTVALNVYSAAASLQQISSILVTASNYDFASLLSEKIIKKKHS
jgi:hypothetical protein